jgi:hypothetical protein
MLCLGRKSQNKNRKNKASWGRSYDHNFLRFFLIFGEKIGFFSKTKVMITIFAKLAVVWAKNANFFANFFGENTLKIITSVPVHPKKLITNFKAWFYSSAEFFCIAFSQYNCNQSFSFLHLYIMGDCYLHMLNMYVNWKREVLHFTDFDLTALSFVIMCR